MASEPSEGNVKKDLGGKYIQSLTQKMTANFNANMVGTSHVADLKSTSLVSEVKQPLATRHQVRFEGRSKNI